MLTRYRPRTLSADRLGLGGARPACSGGAMVFSAASKLPTTLSSGSIQAFLTPATSITSRRRSSSVTGALVSTWAGVNRPVWRASAAASRSAMSNAVR